MKKQILVTQSSMPPLEEYVNEIRSLWESRWLTNMGEKHKHLEADLLKYLKTDNIVLFTNGHLALENVIAAMHLTGEVITTPFTFVSTTNAIVRNGLTPVFCDINDKDYTIDADKIEALITEKTSAIIPVHVYGNLCDVDKIETIAKKHNLKVIYDAAHAFGAERNGVGIANFGDASMFSFHATKVYNTIEGGAICFRDKSLTKTLNDQKNFGFAGPESVTFVGGNAKMNEFQAAMGLCNLRHVDEEIAKRNKVAEKYYELLDGIKGIKLSHPKDNIRHNYAYMPIVFDGYKYTRDEVFEKLKDKNIFARKYFYPLTCDFECYRNSNTKTDVPTAKFISSRVLTIPIYSGLNITEIEKICETLLL
ncbi:MAG: DegT/DnrJ/EryC1/StrS family aminotransferase [Synergistaceae bacterium]|nr:DegT/DnrJ/EryC1/StrS family aminotransferase [Synergistaceae bacterium]